MLSEEQSLTDAEVTSLSYGFVLEGSRQAKETTTVASFCDQMEQQLTNSLPPSLPPCVPYSRFRSPPISIS